MKWISVKDKLPKSGESVLTWEPNLAYNFNVHVVNHPDNFGNITHWMPLPAPPTSANRAQDKICSDDFCDYCIHRLSNMNGKHKCKYPCDGGRFQGRKLSSCA